MKATHGEETLRVLLVEDDEDDYLITREMLQRIERPRFELDWCASYDEALEAVSRAEHDVYLVDYYLGARNGIELLHEAAELGHTVPIIMITGAADGTLDLEAMKAGAADVLAKGELDGKVLQRSIRYAVERAHNLSSLQESQRFLRATLDALCGGIAIVDETGTVLFVNQGWIRLGATSAVIGAQCRMGSNFLEACEAVQGEQREVAAGIAQGVREVLAGERAAFQLDYATTLQDRPGWVEVRMNRFGDDGPTRVVVDYQDVTEQKTLQEQLRRSQKMEAIGQLAGGVAHDFNNLLQIMRGHAELALQEVTEEEPVHWDLEQVQGAVERAGTLTRQLLAFSRQQVLQPTDLNLGTVMLSVAKMLRRLIGEHIEFVVNGHEDVANVRADRGMVEQVLFNLCINARDAMPDGGRLTLEVDDARLDEAFCVRHNWARPGEYVWLEVADTGTGIAPEHMERIFDPFFTTKGTGRGTGLGLSTVYGIVRQHSGLIDVRSRLGEGTTFHVYLPVSPAAEAGPEAPQQRPAQGNRQTVLVAEDDAHVRDLAVRILRQGGYNVLTARDGEETLAVFQEHHQQVHLTLLDVVMPRMLGRHVYDRMRAIQPQVRVLFSSGYSANTIDTEFIRQRGLRLLQKPYSPDDLLHAVAEVLNTPPLRDAGSS